MLSFTVFAQEKKFDEYNQKILGQDYNLVMIPLQKVSFLMGESKMKLTEWQMDEGPQRKVIVDSFWIAKYETTWNPYFNYLWIEKIDKNHQITAQNLKLILMLML